MIARTLLRQPLVLVLDEPTENLDATTARALMAALAEERAGQTTVLITHDPAAAAAFADEVVRMEAGRVVSADAR
ncbi:hypothetical protein [Reyranella sp.]|uniref:hypothetical protein n=1 Tax=Reyranella sp. TaxID=1929291 RepID=UPI003BAD4222